eukprot:Gb_39000 [translate_table: standard]
MGIQFDIPKEWRRGNVIGVGAFGSVFFAINNSNGSLFAVKSTSNCVSSLQNEHNILQSLDSPYIVRCLGHDQTTENGVELYNLFMEYMPGGSIADLLNKFGGHFDESIVQTYTRSILEGIHYLHSQGVVHCDIKGRNILVGSSGVKIADFGSAKRMTNQEKKLKGNEPLQYRGTPLWMAPEVVKQGEQGPPSDIWSLGCTVVEMATGRPPWTNASHPLVAMYRIACTDVVPEMPQSLSPQCRDFIDKCLQRDPKQRWSSDQLLKHPFLNQGCPTQKGQMPNNPPSPTSTLDFHVGEQEWNSYSSASSQTVPILSLQRNLPAGRQAVECDTEEKKLVDQCPRPSPRDRVLHLAADCKLHSIAKRPNSFVISPPGEWIVVRSLKDKSSDFDCPLSYLNKGSLIEDLSPIRYQQAECSAQSASIDCSSVVENREIELALSPLTTPLVDQVNELYVDCCQNICSSDHGSRNILTPRAESNSFHEEVASSSQMAPFGFGFVVNVLLHPVKALLALNSPSNKEYD